MNGPAIGARVVIEARRWRGTPYRHQASHRGVGCDCLGLVRGIWRTLYGREPQTIPAYTPDWGEAPGREFLLEAASRHLHPVPVAAARAGDLLVFRWRREAVAKHLGILTSNRRESRRFIHAWEKAGVVETGLGPSWTRRICTTFRFPEPAEI
ncbi:MAG: NlpC/P60 family protein [Pseudomonadota bacterium]|nr:NlpC/P60 family protein [Pseudomonadota bacterium]